MNAVDPGPEPDQDATLIVIYLIPHRGRNCKQIMSVVRPGSRGNREATPVSFISYPMKRKFAQTKGALGGHSIAFMRSD